MHVESVIDLVAKQLNNFDQIINKINKMSNSQLFSFCYVVWYSVRIPNYLQYFHEDSTLWRMLMSGPYLALRLHCYGEKKEFFLDKIWTLFGPCSGLLSKNSGAGLSMSKNKMMVGSPFLEHVRLWEHGRRGLSRFWRSHTWRLILITILTYSKSKTHPASWILYGGLVTVRLGSLKVSCSVNTTLKYEI